MNRGPVPPTAYEKALTNISGQVVKVCRGAEDAPATASPGESDDPSDDKATKTDARPKIVFYKTEAKGDPGRLSRKIEQIALFTTAANEYNNANSYTTPDFRAGLAARYFDVEIIDLDKASDPPVSPEQGPLIVLHSSAGEEVARLGGSSAVSSNLYSQMRSVLRDEGKDIHSDVIKAAIVLTKLYLVEIQIQKLEKRSGRNIDRKLEAYNEAKQTGLKKYREQLAKMDLALN